MDRMLRRTPVFRQWPETHLRELAAVGRTIRAGAGKAVIRQGELIGGIYVLLSGSIEVYALQEDGKRYIRRYAQPSSAFGFMGVFDAKGSPYSYVAHEPTELIFIRKAAFIGLLMRHPELWLSVAQQLADFQRVALDVVQEHIFEGLRTRLGRALLSLAGTESGRSGVQGRDVRITQDNLASLLGVTRQSVSKELKRMERAGLVRIGYGHIAVLDASGLERLSREALGGPRRVTVRL